MNKATIFAAALSVLLLASCHGHAGGEAHEHEQAAEKHVSEEHAPADEIVLSPEKARAAGVVVETITPGDFRSVIPASGTLLPATGDETTLVATSPGVVSLLRPLAEGSAVGAGEKLFAISSEKLQDGDPTQRAAIAYETARKEFERASRLVKEKIVSEKEFNAAKSNYETARVAYEAVARNKSGNGVVVATPAAGRVTACLVGQGDYVSVGQPLARLTRNGRLQLKVDVPERYYPALREVVAARFKPAYSDRVYDTGELGGRLLAYGRSASAQSGYVPVTFELEGGGDLLQGSFAEVSLLVGMRHNVISLPLSALTEEQGVNFVYLQLDDACYRKQPVLTGSSDGERVEILQGLKGGERVVTRGAIHVKLASSSNMIPAHNHNH